MSTDSFRQSFEAHQGKVSDKWDHYLEAYSRVMAPLRDQPVTILEIGVQNGGSLEIWASYFDKARAIVGVDIDPGCGALKYDDPRISVITGDAKLNDTRESIEKKSSSFDIVIDDGSHMSKDVIATFLSLFPLLAPTGIYIIEDLQCSYWKEFGGELFAPYSAISFFKTLVDTTNQEHWSLDRPAAALLRPFADQVGIELPMTHLEQIESVTFLNSMCMVRKTSGNRSSL